MVGKRATLAEMRMEQNEVATFMGSIRETSLSLTSGVRKIKIKRGPSRGWQHWKECKWAKNSFSTRPLCKRGVKRIKGGVDKFELLVLYIKCIYIEKYHVIYVISPKVVQNIFLKNIGLL